MEKRASLLSFNDHKIWWEKRIFSLMRKNSQSLSVPLMSFFQRLARPPLIFLPPPLTRPNFILVSPGAPCQLLLSFYYPYLFLTSSYPLLFLLFIPFSLAWDKFFLRGFQSAYIYTRTFLKYKPINQTEHFWAIKCQISGMSCSQAV